MATSKTENKSIEMVFPRPKGDMDVYLPKTKGEEFFRLFSADVNSIGEWFKQYEIESMQFKIESIIDSAQTTKLILGSNTYNGLTIVLKPKSTNSIDDTQASC